MRFSETFGISYTGNECWFDAHLKIDTKLFIDPYFLQKADGPWLGAHDELIEHFVHCYELVTKSINNESNSLQSAYRLLTFPEVSELCLGFTKAGTKGAGGGAGFASNVIATMQGALGNSLTGIRAIEEYGILTEGIGADRISDATVNILKHRFIAYTQEVCKENGIEMNRHLVKNAKVDLDHGRWVNEYAELPTNPYSNQPILLVPKHFLVESNIISWENWIGAPSNKDLRQSINTPVGKRASKSQVIQVAIHHYSRVGAWVDQVHQRNNLSGYNFSTDPAGYLQWDKRPREYAEQNPLTLQEVSTHDDLMELISQTVEHFIHYVEKLDGWQLLINDDGSPRREEAAQLLLLGIAQPYLRQYSVELDREIQLGRGKVDFKASSGTNARALIEVKRLSNSKFIQGLEKQIPAYLESDQGTHAWFLVIKDQETKGARANLKTLDPILKDLETKYEFKVNVAIINALPPTAPSKL